MLRQEVDLKESYIGDLMVEDGDLADTSGRTSDTYFQIIRMLLNSAKPESLIYPTLGINLDAYYGGPNTAEVGYEIAAIIKSTIAEETMLYASEIDVTPFPVGKHSIAFKIEIKTIEQGNSLVVSYDTKDNHIRTLNF
jgi:hypothetical protein